MAKCEWYCEYYEVNKSNSGFCAWCNIKGQKITEIKANNPEIYENCPKFKQGKHYSKQPVTLDIESKPK